MTPEEQRIAIAEACGWSVAAYEIGNWILISPSGQRWEKFDSSDIAWSANCIPDYLHDLNAMHEAEKVLTKEQTRIYRQELQDLFPYSIHTPTPAVSATAVQRAEAFLRTINKWTTD